MDIVRCCDRVKLPGGVRKWRRMARVAGFDRMVKVRGFRKSDEHGNRVTIGTMSKTGSIITVHISHGCGPMTFHNPRSYDPLSIFGHELGHFILKQRGKREWATRAQAFHSDAEQRGNAVERACDRYSRLLRARS